MESKTLRNKIKSMLEKKIQVTGGKKVTRKRKTGTSSPWIDHVKYFISQYPMPITYKEALVLAGPSYKKYAGVLVAGARKRVVIKKTGVRRRAGVLVAGARKKALGSRIRKTAGISKACLADYIDLKPKDKKKITRDQLYIDTYGCNEVEKKRKQLKKMTKKQLIDSALGISYDIKF